ncbi:hypothetical protein CR513_42670, partial [Mucuna pruriens]
MVQVDDLDQFFFVKAFQKGLRADPFSDSLALSRSANMIKIRAQVEKHMATWDTFLGERRMKNELWKITIGEIGVERLGETMIERKTSPKIERESTEAHRPDHPIGLHGRNVGRGVKEVLSVGTSYPRKTNLKARPTNHDYEGTILHSDDPMVISIVITDYKVEQVLVDQGILANVLFWPDF